MIRGHTLSSVPPPSIFEVAGYFQAQSSKSTAGTPLNILNQRSKADCIRQRERPLTLFHGIVCSGGRLCSQISKSAEDGGPLV